MKRLTLFLAVWSVTGPGIASDVVVDDNRARNWNRFAGQVYSLHERGLANRQIRQQATDGRYGGEVAKGQRFRDIEYYDAASGLLLSRIRWDRNDAATWHIAEVYVYDDSGRIQRDYAAIYLPWTRNAPIRTFVNLHHHNGEAHAFRQFDASGEPQFERCRGRHDGRPVDISLDPYLIDDPLRRTTAYRACFEGMPAQAGRYLAPQ